MPIAWWFCKNWMSEGVIDLGKYKVTRNVWTDCIEGTWLI